MKKITLFAYWALACLPVAQGVQAQTVEHFTVQMTNQVNPDNSQALQASEDKEPEFVGEAFLVDGDGAYVKLDKSIASYTKGISWKANSFNALSLEIAGAKAKTRVGQSTVRLIVRAVDNNSDPLSVVTIYRLNSKGKNRKTILSKDNTGTLMKSRTYSKNQVMFDGRKYGTSSYLLEINDLTSGEYGIVVANPNNVDEKKTIVSCFGVD